MSKASSYGRRLGDRTLIRVVQYSPNVSKLPEVGKNPVDTVMMWGSGKRLADVGSSSIGQLSPYGNLDGTGFGRGDNVENKRRCWYMWPLF
ncbi:hypothetical protein TNCV_4925471 [Trichonephila clavipes]|nr:hypothetical protein TNCV_4925471 [Trichonephila clavipes]